MPHNIALLRADFEDELARLEELARVFATVREKLDLEPVEVSVYDRGAIGYLLHNFYSGCDNTVPALLDLDVVIDADLGMTPIGIRTGHRRQGFERRALELLEQRAARAGQLLKGPFVERDEQLGDRGGISGHVPPESAVTFERNGWSRWAGIGRLESAR
jgi:hypothetical protein